MRILLSLTAAALSSGLLHADDAGEFVQAEMLRTFNGKHEVYLRIVLC